MLHSRALRGVLGSPPTSRRLCLVSGLQDVVEAQGSLPLASTEPLAARRSQPCKGLAALDQQHLMRRKLLQLTVGIPLLWQAAQQQGAASAQDAASATAPSTAAQELELKAYTGNGYKLQVPAAWDQKSKAGADVLWEDPNKRSTSVGVTVNPVRVTSIDQFGNLDIVGERLLEAERKKESTITVALVSQSSRTTPAGALLYDFEYELNSTRGRKRILNTVTIYNSKLFILNAAYKCTVEGYTTAAVACPSDSPEGSLALLRQVAAGFDVLPAK